MGTLPSTCKRDGCDEPKINLSVLCSRHHAEMLKSVSPRKRAAPNPEVAKALANPDLVEAVMIWTGFYTSSSPLSDDDAIRAHYGKQRSAQLLPILNLVADDFYSSDAKSTARDLHEMGRIVQDEFASRYPNVPNEITKALAWCYTFDNR